jgi:sialate O-acetylesterase
VSRTPVAPAAFALSLVLGLAGAAAAQSPGAAPAAPLLDPMFQDGAIVQRDRPTPVWGRAAPGTVVTVRAGDRAIQALADIEGAWRVDLPAIGAGQRLDLTAEAGGRSQTVSGLTGGDVFLCSGQSNMEWTVRQSANADAELAAVDDPDLRLFNVARSSQPAVRPAGEPVARWTPATRESVSAFSAACYFMGRDLRRTENVPIGLIAASWGGSIIEDWLDEPTLRRLGGFDAALNVLALYARSPEAGEAAYRDISDTWWRGRDEGTRQAWNSPRHNDADWATLPAGGFWETTPELATFDGLVWLRATVRLTRAQARQAARLELGPVDDFDTTWVNGRFVGGQEGWQTPRSYAISPGSLRAGDNLIAVGVLDTGGGGGAWGPAEDKVLVLADGTRIPLGDTFRYRVAAPLSELPATPRTPWIGGSGLTTLYNGMIAPLGPWGLKGVAWYQGESNVSDAARYRDLLNGLFSAWRARFESPDLPFLVVQLADFGPRASQPTRSFWAELRESQRRVVAADGRAGLAVAIDIGDRFDIHPTNKQEVGRRLALEARRVAYGRDAPRSPEPTAVFVDGGDLRVAYPAGTTLTAYGSDRIIGLQVCDATGACRWSEGRVDGDGLRLPAAPDIARVRFCWADSPICNLYSGDGLPATPFELTVSR